MPDIHLSEVHMLECRAPDFQESEESWITTFQLRSVDQPGPVSVDHDGDLVVRRRDDHFSGISPLYLQIPTS